MNADLIHIPDGKLHFALQGKELALDPILALREISAIFERTKGKGNYEYIDEFIAWVKTQTGVELAPGEAAALWRAIQVAEKQAGDRFLSLLQSPASTPG